MDVVHTFLPGVFLLQSPHGAEIGRGAPLDRINPVENRLQVLPCIFADDADIDPLPVAEPFRHFGYFERLALPAPVVAAHLQIMTVLYSLIFLRFGHRIVNPARCALNLSLQ